MRAVLRSIMGSCSASRAEDNPGPTTFRTEAILSIHRWMVGLVTPELRAVSFSAVHPTLEARFFLETADEENVDIVDEIETLVAADFLDGVHVSIRSVELAPSEPLLLPPGHAWLFVRRETNDPI